MPGTLFLSNSNFKKIYFIKIEISYISSNNIIPGVNFITNNQTMSELFTTNNKYISLPLSELK